MWSDLHMRWRRCDEACWRLNRLKRLSQLDSAMGLIVSIEFGLHKKGYKLLFLAELTKSNGAFEMIQILQDWNAELHDLNT